MVLNSLKRLLAQLSLKWKPLDDIEFDKADDLDWLFAYGLIEGGMDVGIKGTTSGEVKRMLYVFSGADWRDQLLLRTVSDSEMRNEQHLVQLGIQWDYVRLTPAGIEQKRSDVLSDSMVGFRIEQVDCFEEHLTDEDRERLAEDENLRLYYQTNIKEGYRELNLIDLAFYVTRDGIKQRVTLAEYARLELGFSAEHIVVGQQHESIQRDLIAILWPDLAEPIELDGSVEAYNQASQRLRNWTGIRMPFCHRDWRALSEWAGLEPDEITDDWLDGFLVPRLRVLWLKKTTATISEPKTESALESPDDESETSKPTIHPVTAEPPEAFCKDGRPIGPLSGNRTALGFALHDEDNLSQVAYRNQFAAKVANGTVWVRESTHSRKLDMFVPSFKVRDSCLKRLEKFAERK